MNTALLVVVALLLLLILVVVYGAAKSVVETIAARAMEDRAEAQRFRELIASIHELLLRADKRANETPEQSWRRINGQ